MPERTAIRRVNTVLVLLILAGLSAIMPGNASGQEFVEVDIVDFAFVPSTATMELDDALVWNNRSTAGVTHTVTADDGEFDSGDIEAGGGFDFQFEEPGTYTYHCEIHTDMRGTVVVNAREEPTATPMSPPPPTATSEPQREPTPTNLPAATRTPITPVTVTPGGPPTNTPTPEPGAAETTVAASATMSAIETATTRSEEATAESSESAGGDDDDGGGTNWALIAGIGVLVAAIGGGGAYIARRYY